MLVKLSKWEQPKGDTQFDKKIEERFWPNLQNGNVQKVSHNLTKKLEENCWSNFQKETFGKTFQKEKFDKKEQGKDVNQTVKMGTTQRGYTMW